MYDTIELIKQAFNDLEDKFDANRSENHKTYQSYEHIHYVAIDCILMCIIIIICAFYFVYPLINCLAFHKRILLYHFMQIIISLMIYSITLYHYYNQAVQFYSIITYFMVFIIGNLFFSVSFCMLSCPLIQL